MKINEIKAALAQMAQKMEPVTAPSIPQQKTEVKEQTPTAPMKTTTPRKRSVSSEQVKQPDPIPVKQIDTVPEVPAEVKASPVVETETKAPVPAKKTTSRKAKTATVIPIDGIEAVVAKYLKPKVHFDTINGLGRKPVLLKAGAEKLAEIYGFRTTSKVINRVERFDQLFVLYEVQTTVFDADGNILGEGLGSCTTKERKYQRGDFAANLNTVLKMAKKRSYVDAVLTATHASGVFTQDIEDIAVDIRQAEAVG